ncbi:hypothetical protein FDUTEX481_04330 [Tolypothrix sp. PCC 7601]|nr:hypothetical protein FDUTEX481_04330 [Tolypothrix sp. PCC 7601]
MPDYNLSRDRWTLCQTPGCNDSRIWENLPLDNFDTYLLPAISQKLDRINREHWQNRSISLKVREVVKETAELKSMRKRDRTHEEHQLIQNHHDLVRNKRYKIDQEKAQELAQLRDEQC